jgi:3-oxoacyl-[acyl-carrier protein] reductase
MGRLSGKVAVITGAGQGIGRGIALRFAEEGANLALCDLNLETAEETAGLARAKNVEAAAWKTNVAERADVEFFVGAAVERFGGLDVLVNNAGIFFNASFEGMTDDQWDRMMNVNVKSVFMMSQAVVRHWLATERKGSIVNLASISAAIAFTNSSAYCASKAAVASMTRCVALEYGGRGIRANSMAPGIIDTPLLPNAADSAHWAQNKIPLRRLGQPDDVADLALFLASDESRYITGDMIYVDGGWMLE